MLIGISALALLLVVCSLLKIFTTAEAVNILLLGALVLVTAVYTHETAELSASSEKSRQAMEEQAKATSELAKITREQTMASQRPLIVPKGLGVIIEGYKAPVRKFHELRLQQVKNIGLGPAYNISMRVERRPEGEPVKTVGNPIASIPPLASGEDSIVRHFGSIPEFKVNEDEWLVVLYEDVFGNRFHTECQWSGVAWHNFMTQDVVSQTKVRELSSNSL